MTAGLGLGLMVAGGLTALLTGVAGNLILLRRFGAISAETGDQAESSSLNLLFQLLLLAGVGALGLGTLVVGAVVRYQMSGWALVVPACLAVAGFGGAWAVRRRLARRHQPAKGS
ncbi:MAG: hypothetical protein ACHQ0J_15780 [Candidatus Dormibacterales bacterium]